MVLSAIQDPRGGHNRKSVNSDFFKQWSPTMAYVLGFIYADGAIEDVQKSSRTCYLSIVSKDISILQSIASAMNSSHVLQERKPQIITFPGGKIYRTQINFCLRIGSKTIYNNLLRLGVTPKKSLTILFPKIPRPYIPFFLRGYFDGDGTLYLRKGKYPRVVFSSGSLLFLKGLSEILCNELAISAPYLSPLGTNRCYQLVCNSYLSKKILEYMYKDLDKSPYLERKFKIYQKYLSL